MAKESKNPGTGEEQNKQLPPSLKDITEGLEERPDADEEEEEEEEEIEDQEDEEEENNDESEDNETEKVKPKAKKEEKPEKKEEIKDPKDDEDEKDEEEEEENTASIWEDVEKLTGEKVEVDFEGVDPETPEGVAKYVRAFRDKGLEDYEAILQQKAPKAFRALEMELEGLDPSILFEKKETPSFKAVILDEGNVDQQKNIYVNALKSRGVPEEDILELVKVAADSGKLLDKAKVGLAELQKREQDSEVDRDRKAAELVNKKRALAQSMVNNIASIVTKGEVGGIVIPEADKKALYSKVVSNIQIDDNGNYVIMRTITPQDLEKEIQSEYFKLKNGNLSELVQRKAKTEHAKKIKRSLKSGDNKLKQSTNKITKNKALSEL